MLQFIPKQVAATCYPSTLAASVDTACAGQQISLAPVLTIGPIVKCGGLYEVLENNIIRLMTNQNEATMEPVTFGLYAPVKNTINKALGVVTKITGDNITVQIKSGDRMTFKAQYLAPASAEEAETLKLMTEQLKEEDKKKPVSHKITDPEKLRSACDKFIHHIALRYPKSAEAFKEFWLELLSIAGDEPGKTWDMKPNTSSNPCPVLKVYNPASQKWVYCLSLIAGYGLRMEIKKDLLPPGTDALFPIDHAMFGSGRAIELTYKDFTPQKRQAYLDCIKEIYKKAPRPEQTAEQISPKTDIP